MLRVRGEYVLPNMSTEYKGSHLPAVMDYRKSDWPTGVINLVLDQASTVHNCQGCYARTCPPGLGMPSQPALWFAGDARYSRISVGLSQRLPSPIDQTGRRFWEASKLEECRAAQSRVLQPAWQLNIQFAHIRFAVGVGGCVRYRKPLEYAPWPQVLAGTALIGPLATNYAGG